LLEHGELNHFKLVRIRKPGSIRGAVFVHVPSLLAFLRGEMEKQTGAVADALQSGREEVGTEKLISIPTKSDSWVRCRADF
jgi:hypothetical protein